MDIVKKIGTAILLVSSVFFASSSFAQITPESGWWWNPAEGGRGFSIEIQDNYLFMAVYTYDAVETDGVRRPIWYSSVGQLTDDDVYEGTLLLLEDGQCLGCEHDGQPPINDSESLSIRIEFSTRTTAEATIDGDVVIPLERFQFAPQFANNGNALLGEWHLIAEHPNQFSSQDYIAHLFVFDDVYTEDDMTYISGCRPTVILNTGCSDTDEVVLGGYNEDIGQYLILTEDESSSTTWRAFWLNLDTNRLSGSFDAYSKSTGSFDWDEAVPARAYRSASKTFVQTGQGPAKPELSAFISNERILFIPEEMKPALTVQEKAELKERIENDTEAAMLRLMND